MFYQSSEAVVSIYLVFKTLRMNSLSFPLLEPSHHHGLNEPLDHLCEASVGTFSLNHFFNTLHRTALTIVLSLASQKKKWKQKLVLLALSLTHSSVCIAIKTVVNPKWVF